MSRYFYIFPSICILFFCLTGFNLAPQNPIVGLWHLIKVKTDNKIVEIYRNNPHVSIQFLGNATMIRKSSEQETEFFTYTYQPKDSTIAVQENEALMKIVKYSADSLTLSMKKDKQEVIFIYAKHQYEK